MNSETPRRQFLGSVVATAAAAGMPIGPSRREAGAQASSPDAWLSEVKGAHRCLFDFPQHRNAWPLTGTS